MTAEASRPDVARGAPPVILIDASTPIVAAGRPGRRPEPRVALRAGLAGLPSKLGSLALSLTVAGLVLWAADAAPPIHAQAALLFAGGKVAGLVGGVLLFVQFILMARLEWLNRRMSTVDLHALHRDVGGLLLVAVVAHAAMMFEGTAIEAQIAPVVQLRRWLDLPELVTASAATLLLLGLGLLAMRGVRALLPYELWYHLHLGSYAVLGLAYAHEYAVGTDMASSTVVHMLWTVMYGVTAAALIWGRVVAPIRLNLRHRLRVAEVRAEGSEAFSIYVTGRRLGELRAEAGQFFRWRFAAPGSWWQSHPFSLSAAPNGKWLRCTVTSVGSHTRALRELRPGARVFVSGPAGTSTPSRRTRRRALLIAGGAGIAQARGLLEGLSPGTVVIYRARTVGHVIFDRELARLATTRSARIFYVVGAREDPGPASVMSPEGLARLVPDVRRRDVFVCCSQGLTGEVVDILGSLGLPSRQVHIEPYEF